MECIICKRDLMYDEIEAVIADRCLCSIGCVRIYFTRKELADGLHLPDLPEEVPPSS